MRLVFEGRFDIAPAELFALHADPSCLVKVQDPARFELVSHDGHIRPGARTVVKNRVGRIWLTMTFEHFLYEPPVRFGERMIKGPFRTFEHIHEFEADGNAALMRDLIDARLPWWQGGAIAMRLVSAPMIRKAFAYRHEALGRLIEDGT